MRRKRKGDASRAVPRSRSCALCSTSPPLSSSLVSSHTHSLYKLALPMSADQLLSFSASVISSTVVAGLGE